MKKEIIIILIEVILVFLLIMLVTFLIRLNNAYKLEKRIVKYSVKSRKRKNISFNGNLISWYFSFVKSHRKRIKKLFPKIVKKYDKYVIAGSKSEASDYVTHKILIGILFMFIMLLFMIRLLFKLDLVVILIFMILMFFIGFYILDLILLVIDSQKRKKIKNNMLQAIMIMNSAFKSGKSTVQAVEIVSNKLSGAIGSEFRNILQELKYGLSVDVVFDRFSKRVEIEEAEYISSSLTILYRTGGNITAVFDSIEKTLFDKMKLKDELNSTLLMHKVVIVILSIIPIVMIKVFDALSPGYFNAFFESTMGVILFSISIILFIIYVLLLVKIVKVEY